MGRRLRMAIMGSMAAVALVGFGSIGAAASHGGGGSGGGGGGGHSGGTSSGTCSLSPATLGGQLTISGRGFTPGASYTLDVTWPYGGSGFLFTTADSSGNWSVITQALWAGTYSVEVLTGRGGAAATCSETVT
jgi:hypothetical protein